MVEVLIFASGGQQQKALLELLNSHNLSNVDDSFYEATVTRHNLPVRLKIVIALLPLHISNNHHQFIEKAIDRFSPKIVLFLGLAESVKDEVSIGDIVIASQVIDLAAANTRKGSHTFWPSLSSNTELVEIAQSMMNSSWSEPLSKIYSKSRSPRVVIAPIIHTDKLLAVNEMDTILRQQRKVTAVDMESANFVRTTNQKNPKIKVLVIKGICGKSGIREKDSSNVEYACDVTSAFSLEFIKRASKPSFVTNAGRTGDSSDKNNYRPQEEEVSVKQHADSSIPPRTPEVTTGNELNFQQYQFAGKKHFHFFADIDPRQMCLGISDYAKAIAHVLDHAKGEVCLSIMGHWGRGKTFLMSSVEKELQKPDLTHRYRTIWFSAWKYRTFPEAWVHLYQTFADASLSDGIISSIPRTFRMNLKKMNIWPVFTGIASINLIILPFFDKVLVALGVFTLLLSILGIIGLLKVILASRSIAKTTRILSEKYLRPTSHEEKLGLQASIGKDLKHLITGWFDKGSLGFQHLIIYAILVVITAFVIHLSLSGDRVLVYGIPLRPSVYIVNVIICLWGMAAIIGPIWLLCGGKKENRLLLIVDDLDRCPSGQILDIIESIKLLLEDKEISKYVQITMLVEHEMLKEAILSKYKITNLAYTPERIIEDNIYKLFLATLTLPPLTSKEIAEIADAYIVVPNSSSSDNENTPINNYEVKASSPNAAIYSEITDESLDNVGSSESQPSNHTLTPTSHLDVIEQKALVTVINDRSLWGEKRSVTPRAIQSLLLRYQLARYLLMLQGATYDPYQLTRLLIGSSINNNETLGSNPDVEEAILAAVSRVSI